MGMDILVISRIKEIGQVLYRDRDRLGWQSGPARPALVRPRVGPRVCGSVRVFFFLHFVFKRWSN